MVIVIVIVLVIIRKTHIVEDMISLFPSGTDAELMPALLAYMRAAANQESNNNKYYSQHQGIHLSNTTCITHVFFTRGE